MDHIEQIARLITDDPDIILEAFAPEKLKELQAAHSFEEPINAEERPPSGGPEILFHYTSPSSLENILAGGIREMTVREAGKAQPAGYYFTKLKPGLRPAQTSRRIYGSTRAKWAEKSKCWVKVNTRHPDSYFGPWLRTDPATGDSYFLPVNDKAEECFWGTRKGSLRYLPVFIEDFGCGDNAELEARLREQFFSDGPFLAGQGTLRTEWPKRHGKFNDDWPNWIGPFQIDTSQMNRALYLMHNMTKEPGNLDELELQFNVKAMDYGITSSEKGAFWRDSDNTVAIIAEQ